MVASKKAGRTNPTFEIKPSRPAHKERRASAPLPETISSWDEFYAVVRRIPRGRVTTYGAVAAMAGHPRSARHVGFALAAWKETGKKRGVPWQRVLGAKSKSSAAVTIKDPIGGALQRMLLESEGVVFDARGNVSIARFGWFEGMKGSPKKPTKRGGASG